MLIVQKFGGSSVTGDGSFARITERVQNALAQGDQVVVVVSAFFGATDSLLKSVESVIKCSIDYKMLGSALRSEIDTVIATGEQDVAALIAIDMLNAGVKARSFMGWQCPIYTDDNFGSAKIESIDVKELKAALSSGIVPVVAGFQGIDPNSGRIATLGRGGTDYTAVALAVALGADRCDIYTDVDGVYSVDPNFCPSGRLIDSVSFDEMLELSLSGAKVLQKESVMLSMLNDIRLRVLSSKGDNCRFTDIVRKKVELDPGLGSFHMDGVKGIAKMDGMSLVKIEAGVDILGFIALLSRMKIEPDMLSIDYISSSCKFAVMDVNMSTILSLVHNEVCEKYAVKLSSISNLTKLSIVGLGVKSNPEYIGRACAALSNEGYRAWLISVGELSGSFLVDTEDARVITLLWAEELGLTCAECCDNHGV